MHRLLPRRRFASPSRWRAFLTALALLITVPLAPAADSVATAAPVIQIDTGTLRGVGTPDHRAFLGIPFGKPPVGALRWQPPVPASAWSGERDATRMAVPCAQPRSYFEWRIEASQEDCLYLNVYTPPGATPDAKLPVLVWLHGGANVIGSASGYPAGTLARTGDVVVVTVNYRLGVFGFLALPAMVQAHRALNFGIQDQQLALRWVQRNIAAFGGDAQRVTVAGQSAGAGDVLAHLVSPSSEGLFHQAIVQSGSYAKGALGKNLLLEQAFVTGRDVAKAAGCTDASDELACLRAKSTAEVLAASPYDESFLHPKGIWGVIMDGELVPKQVYEQLAAGEFKRMPILTGFTRHEFRLLVALAYDAVDGKPPTEEDRKTALNFLTGSSAGNALNIFYPSWLYGSPFNAMGSLLGDFIAVCPAHHQAKILSKYVPTFAYRFDDPNAPSVLRDPALKMGAYHAAELQYLFDQPSSVRLDEKQKALALQMKKYWANFIHTGDPRQNKQGVDSSVPAWPRFNALTTPYRAFKPGGPADILLPGVVSIQHQCGLWDAVQSLIPAPGAAPPPPASP
jgi:para-nitrobenzyl esterase